eukprot:403342348
MDQLQTQIDLQKFNIERPIPVTSLFEDLESQKAPPTEKVEDTYAQIVANYKKSKLIPWRRFIETPSFMNFVGPLSSEDVIDLACGEGFYTRKFRQMTNGKVYGVDFSENMINLAQYQLTDGMDINFSQQDCSLPVTHIPHQFDLVTPTFLLQNATSEERFEQMVRNIWNLCKPGGRVCGMGSSPKLSVDKLKKEEKYGRFYTVEPETYFKENASRYVVRIVDEEANLDINLVLNWFSAEHYERTFKKLGFVDFKWVPMSQFGDEGNEEYWKDMVNDCSIIMYEAWKPLN